MPGNYGLISDTLVQRKEEAAKEYISYDELRQKNRAAYERSLAQTPAAQRGPIRRVPLPARAQPPAPISSDAYSPSLSTTDPVARQPSGLFVVGIKYFINSFQMISIR